MHGCNIGEYKAGNGGKCKIEALSHNQFCDGKVFSFTYSECVSVAWGMQLIMRLRNFIICVLPGCTEFFHFFSQTVQFSKKKILELNLCLILSTTFFWTISHLKNLSAWYYSSKVFRWSNRYYFQIVLKLEFSRDIVEKYSNIKFYGNPSAGAEFLQEDGRKDGQRET